MEEKDTTRLEAFSDGVFAIAITLLVLELKVPHLEGEEATNGHLWSRVLSLWPSYFALVTSFFSVLIMWIHHHTLLKLARRTTPRLLFANGILLLMVTLVPFPTEVVSDYLRTPAAQAATLVYSLTFLGIGIGFWWLMVEVCDPRVLSPHASRKIVTNVRKGYRWGPPMYALAAVASAISPWLSLAVCTGLWILWALMTRSVCTAD